MKEERENISQMPKSDKERTALLFEALKHRLKDAPDKDAAAVFASWDTAETAIFLYGIRNDVGKGGTKFDQLHCILDSRKEYDGLRFKKLILDLIDAFFDVFDAADFYSGLRQIGFYETPALRMTAEGGFIDEIDSAKKSPANLIHGYLQSGIDNRLIEIVFRSLDSLLRSLCKANDETPFIRWDEFGGFFYQFSNTATNEEMFGPDPAPDINDFRQELDKISHLFKNLYTLLRLREHKIYDQHHEWEVTIYETSKDAFDGSEYRRKQSKALHAYYEQYGNPLGRFEEITNILVGKYKIDAWSPASAGKDFRPFLASYKSDDIDGYAKESEPWDYSSELKKLFSTPVDIEVALPDYACDPYSENTARLHLNPWIAAAKKKMYDAFNAYCRKCEAELPDGISRELLKKEAAELISSRRDNEAAITPAQELTKKSENNRKPNRKRKGKGGRPKIGAEDKNDQLRIARNWLKDNPGLKNSQLANHVFDLDRKNPSLHRHGYIPPKDGKRLADTALMKAIRDDKEIKAIRDEQKRVKAQ